MEKPSIGMIPSGYKDGKLYSVYPLEGLGEELVENGKFDSQSEVDYWSIASSRATKSLEDGFMRLTYDSTVGAALFKNNLVPLGRYKVTFRAKGTANTNFASIGDNASISNNPEYVISNPILTTDWQKYDFEIELTQSTFRFYLNTLSIGDTLDIDDISVKGDTSADFDFVRGSLATRVNAQGLVEDVNIISEELTQNGSFDEIGSEEILNGGFDTDSDWVKGTGWSISGGEAICNATGGFSSFRQTGILTSGKIYKITFDFDGSGVTSGSFKLNGADFGNASSAERTIVDGANVFYVEATSSDFGINESGAVGTGIFDNISCKEVGQNWTFGTGWSIEDGKAVYYSSPTSTNYLEQNAGLTNGSIYRINWEVVDYVGGTLGISGQSGSKTGDDSVASNGQYTTFLTSNGAALKFYANSNASISNVSVKEVTDATDLPRLDYSDGSCPSLLLEPQSTNLITHSEDFSDSSWLTAGAFTRTSNYGTSPDGANNSTRIQGDNTSVLYFNPVSTTGFARSIYIKATSGTGNIQLLSHNSNTNNTFSIDENWQRVEINSVDFALGNNNFYAFDMRGASTDIYDIEIWGAQAEDNISYATSYIPTNGTVQTRLKDQASRSGISNLINSEEGVLYAEISGIGDDNVNRLISLSDGTSDNRVIIQYDTSNNLYLRVISGGVVSMQKTQTISDITDNFKVAIKYKENDFACWIDGVEVHTDTIGAAPIGLDRVGFDNSAAGAVPFHGKVKDLRVYTTALSDEDLQYLTT